MMLTDKSQGNEFFLMLCCFSVMYLQSEFKALYHFLTIAAVRKKLIIQA